MKVYVISDIHGSKKYLEDFLNIFDNEKGDKLIILGDVLYHGPRNPFPLEYSPKDVIKLLNERKDKIIWIKGNCDSEVDEMVLDFPCEVRKIVSINNKTFHLTHGHKENIDNMTIEKGEILLYGHFHVNFIEEVDGKIIANPGSISLPKNDTKNSYMVIENNKMTIYSLEHEKLIEKDM